MIRAILILAPGLAACAATAFAQLPAGLVGVWRCNEGLGAGLRDRTEFANDGGVQGANWAPGRFSPALAFDGVNDVVLIADTPSLDVAGLTVAAWIRPNLAPDPAPAVPKYQALLRKGDQYALGFQERKLLASLTTDRLWETRGASPISNNAWMFVALTFDPNDVGMPASVADLTGLRLDREAGVIIPIGAASDWDRVIREIGNVVEDPNSPDPAKRFKTWYSAYVPPYAQNNVFIGYASSPDGLLWTKRGQVLPRALEDPYVVLQDGVFYLFAEDKQDVPARNIRRYHSTDGESWTDDGVVLQPVPLSNWERNDVSSPVVHIENGVWNLLYEGRGTTDGRTGLATSADGLTWVREPGNPVFREGPPSAWDATSTIPDDLILWNGVYYLSYHARNVAYSTGLNLTGFASSSNLRTWTRSPGNPTGPNNSNTVMIGRRTDPNGEVGVFFHSVDEYAQTGIHRYHPWQLRSPRLFINAVEERYWGRDDPGAAPLAAGSAALAFGRRSTSPTAWYPGLIDEVYLFDRALPPAELSQLYASTLHPYIGPGPYDWLLFDAWQFCLQGPGVGLAAACYGPDLELDFDADLADFAHLQARFSGDSAR